MAPTFSRRELDEYLAAHPTVIAPVTENARVKPAEAPAEPEADSEPETEAPADAPADAERNE